MALVAGSVTVNSMGVPSYSPASGPNLAKELYLARTATMNLPNPAVPKGCQLTVQANPGDTSLSVGNTFVGGGWSALTAYVVGDTLGQLNYIGALVGGKYVASTVTLVVGSIPDSAHLVLAAPLPSFPLPSGPNPVLPVGTAFGFQGTATAWSAATTGVLVSVLQQQAALATADADTIVAHFETNAVLTGYANNSGTHYPLVGGVD